MIRATRLEAGRTAFRAGRGGRLDVGRQAHAQVPPGVPRLGLLGAKRGRFEQVDSLVECPLVVAAVVRDWRLDVQADFVRERIGRDEVEPANHIDILAVGEPRPQ